MNVIGSAEDDAAMTNEITTPKMHAVSAGWQKRVNALADLFSQIGEVPLPVEQHLHGGVYSRTLLQKAGVVCATALVRVPTQLIVSGHARIYCEDNVIEVKGYRVLEGLPGRQMVVYTLEDTWATCFFATQAKTVAEAEAEAVGEEVARRLTNHRLLEG